jgi:phosphatidylinositol glycan class N
MIRKLITGLPLTLPVIGPSLVWPRLIGIVITLTPSFLLLSLSYEGIFFAVLVVALAIWIRLEAVIPPSDSFWTQLRRSYFFLFLTFLSFFGLGNLASLNSFDPSSVRCFVTTFSPFTMAGLLLWKITVPFIAVSSALWAITLQHQLSMKNVYLMILLLSAAMAVQFFHWVTSRGSWLDIGTSLSHYVIVQFTVVFVMLLRSVVQFLTHGPIYFYVRPTASKYDKD